MKQKANFEEVFEDQQYLKSIPQNAFSKEYMRFMQAKNLTVDGLIKAQEDAGVKSFDLEPNRKLFGANGFQLHDVIHVLLGYGTDPVGEACVLTFTAAQLELKSVHRMAKTLALKERIFFPKVDTLKIVKEAYNLCQSSKWICDKDWRELIKLSREKVLEQLDVGQAENYHQRKDLFKTRSAY